MGKEIMHSPTRKLNFCNKLEGLNETNEIGGKHFLVLINCKSFSAFRISFFVIVRYLFSKRTPKNSIKNFYEEKRKLIFVLDEI